MRQRRQRRRRQVVAAAAGGYLLASAGLAIVLLNEPDAAPAAPTDVVLAAPASQWSDGTLAHAQSPPARPGGPNASQGKARSVTVTVTPGDGENLTVATPPKGPVGTLSRGAAPAGDASIDDAWKLFQQAANPNAPAGSVEAPRLTERTVSGLKGQRTVSGKAMTSAQVGKQARQQAEAPAVAPPAPVSQEQWTLLLGAHESRADAVEAAASAAAHLAHQSPSVNVNPFVAVDDTADESQRYVALIAGFDDRQDAEHQAESLVRFGYRGQPLLVDFSSSR